MPLVVTRARALAEGRTAAQVDALVRSGAWLALRRAVYLTQPELPSDPAVAHGVLVLAAALATAVPSVGSHRSAALVHGLPLLLPFAGPPVLTRLRAPHQGRPDGRRAATLTSQVPADEWTTVHGAPVTTVARTAVDLARCGSDLDAVLALDAALRTVPRDVLEDVLGRQAGWPGSARAARRLVFADGSSESPLESVGRLRFAQQGLPPPRLQVLLGGLDGPVGRADFVWDQHRTVGEADGRLKYADASDLWEEKLREDRMRDAGFEVFRFTWVEALHHPALVADRARRAFARAARSRRAA